MQSRYELATKYGKGNTTVRDVSEVMTGVKLYRAKQEPIEAVQYNGYNFSLLSMFGVVAEPVGNWGDMCPTCGGVLPRDIYVYAGFDRLEHEREIAHVGDYIFKTSHGRAKVWPRDSFEKTHEEVHSYSEVETPRPDRAC